MLRAASIILTFWSCLNFLFAFIILKSMVLFNKKSPILVMQFDKSDLIKIDNQIISVVNSLAILYNSCSISLSIVSLIVIWTSLIKGQTLAFWILLVTIGLVQIMGFIAFSKIRNKRLPVNIILSSLYVLGIGLAGLSIFSQ
jgi:hypothetical protein